MDRATKEGAVSYRHSLRRGTRVQSLRVEGPSGLGTIAELRKGDERYGVKWDARKVIFTAYLHQDFEPV